jgi:Na+/melibiose symporter-like transporter
MTLLLLWRLLHIFFAFGFVGSLVVCDWNSRAARATEDWQQRALLWDIIRRASGVGLGTLLVLGVMGNLLSSGLGYRMSAEAWPRWVNGLWVIGVILQGVVIAPGAARLAGLAKAAAEGGSAEAYPAAVRRWRLVNVAQSVIYMSLLVLMVFRWRS